MNQSFKIGTNWHHKLAVAEMSYLSSSKERSQLSKRVRTQAAKAAVSSTSFATGPNRDRVSDAGFRSQEVKFMVLFKQPNA